MKFSRWFKEQRGRLPLSDPDYQTLKQNFNKAIEQAEILETMLREENELRAEYNTAHYAWNIKDKHKGKKEDNPFMSERTVIKAKYLESEKQQFTKGDKVKNDR